MAAVYGAPPASGAVKLVGPRANAGIGQLAIQGGRPPNADREVAGMRAAFRACYGRLLAETSNNSKLEGKVRMKLSVDASGSVKTAEAVPDNPGLAPALSCMRSRALAGHFDSVDAPSTIEFEVTLVRLLP